MLAFIARRLLALIPLLLIVTFLAFGLVFLLPGDAASVLAGQEATPEQIDQIRVELGLDRPFTTQYVDWLTGAARGDFGNSLIFPDREVGAEIRSKFLVTLSVVVGAITFAVFFGSIIGVIAGLRPGRTIDRVLAVVTSVAIGLPSYVIAVLLVAVFAVNLGVLPSIGYTPFTENPVEWAQHLIMPWIALGIPASASLARQVRGALADAMQEDYVRTARAKGLSSGVIVWKHAMKNASMPALTVLGIQFAYMLGGTVIIETIFSINGLGQMIQQSISGRDLPVIQGVAFTMAVVFLVVNLAVDVMYAVVNPKVRVE